MTLSLSLSSLPRSVSWEVNKPNVVYIVKLWTRIKVIHVVLVQCACLVCMNALCSKDSGQEVSSHSWVTANAVLCMIKRGQYNIREKQIQCNASLHISLSLISPSPWILSWYHFFPPHSAPSFLYACLSLTPFTCTYNHTHTHRTIMCTHTAIHRATCSCEIISSLIHTAQLWATMRVIRKE